MSFTIVEVVRDELLFSTGSTIQRKGKCRHSKMTIKVGVMFNQTHATTLQALTTIKILGHSAGGYTFSGSTNLNISQCQRFRYSEFERESGKEEVIVPREGRYLYNSISDTWKVSRDSPGWRLITGVPDRLGMAETQT